MREGKAVLEDDQYGPLCFLRLRHICQFLTILFPSLAFFHSPTYRAPWTLFKLSDPSFDPTFGQHQNSEASPRQLGQPISHKGTIHGWERDSQFAQGPRVWRKEVTGALMLMKPCM